MSNAFLNPTAIQDTPRLFTALAEWLAVFVYYHIYKRRYFGKDLWVVSAIALALQVIVQFVAGLLPIYFWIPTMVVAVGIIYISLFFVLDIKPRDCAVLTTHAFVLAEFAASLYTQLEVWFLAISGRKSFAISCCVMIVVYTAVYLVYYRFERGNISRERDLNITTKEMFSVLATGVGAFIMSNISFVWAGTPFSASENMLYVRTLVDFGGMLMLMTEMGRRNELSIKNENDAINLLFRRQYEQYKLAIDNSEALRKEIHDMKHYVAALKSEDDPKKRAEVLDDMEQAIAIQESFMNTGNQVLDVILTTKSLQCAKKEITLNAMVDGPSLAGIHVKDICSLFGNLLDNAIEATQQTENVSKRLITLSVRKRNQFIIVECENYAKNPELEKQVQMAKEMGPIEKRIRTTKADPIHHGYGLKSISQVAEKYDGAMQATYEDGWFKVKVLLNAK